MKRHLQVFTLALLAVFAMASIANAQDSAKVSAKVATLYKTPQCGCCEGYADHLRDHGFTVTVKPTSNLPEISSRAGIPEDFQGCHTTFIDGYVVSGHVPANIVKRLLALRPAIKGITLPGMPMGSPGMGGAKEEPFTIFEVKDGAPKIYAVD